MSVFILKVSIVTNEEDRDNQELKHQVYEFDRDREELDAGRLKMSLRATERNLDDTLELVENWINNCYGGEVLEVEDYLLICLGSKYKIQKIAEDIQVSLRIQTVDAFKLPTPVKPMPKKGTPIHNPADDTSDDEE